MADPAPPFYPPSPGVTSIQTPCFLEQIFASLVLLVRHTFADNGVLLHENNVPVCEEDEEAIATLMKQKNTTNPDKPVIILSEGPAFLEKTQGAGRWAKKCDQVVNIRVSTRRFTDQNTSTLRWNKRNWSAKIKLISYLDLRYLFSEVPYIPEMDFEAKGACYTYRPMEVLEEQIQTQLRRGEKSWGNSPIRLVVPFILDMRDPR